MGTQKRKKPPAKPGARFPKGTLLGVLGIGCLRQGEIITHLKILQKLLHGLLGNLADVRALHKGDGLLHLLRGYVVLQMNYLTT